MKPVAIFRHSPGEGPGYFATFLEGRSVPWTLIRVDAGEAIPHDPSAYSGLAFMGGPMSVNDPLPWVEEECALIRAAIAADIPVVGHCLGGQLMAKALGGNIGRNPVKEIGWGTVRVPASEAARAWLPGVTEFLSFHWHGETFSLPEGASLIMENGHCRHQAFVLGKHLAMQCHVEMTEDMIRQWNRQWAEETGGSSGPAIQTPEEMYQDIATRVQQLTTVATLLYGKWAEGLKG